MIEPVRIGFSTTNALLSRLIRRLTGSRASHAFLVCRDVDFERDMVMEAVGDGFRIVAYDRFQRHNTVVAELAPAHSIERGLRRAVDWLGSAYDTRGLAGMLVVLIRRWLRLRTRSVRLRNPFARSRALFCSEAVARACRWADYPGFDLDPESTTPQDLLDFFTREASGLEGSASDAVANPAAPLCR